MNHKTLACHIRFFVTALKIPFAAIAAMYDDYGQCAMMSEEVGKHGAVTLITTTGFNW